ncbi:MAG: insulinase family protein, partial [Oscillospiraceae bacterium]|nr:insulinase family protein [Oscillospiraceae bacterium]
MTRTEIAKGIFFSEIEGDYKKSRLGIHLAAPLERRTITSTALIPLLLERGTESCPDMTQLKRRLNALYGAYMSASYSCVG